MKEEQYYIFLKGKIRLYGSFEVWIRRKQAPEALLLLQVSDLCSRWLCSDPRRWSWAGCDLQTNM